MKTEPKSQAPNYSAPALEKGLDILELLSSSDAPLSLAQIAKRLGRSVSELYRMLTCLVNRHYVAQDGDAFSLTTKLFELAHINPPTHRLLVEASPIMQRLTADLIQACHLTVYNQGTQVVIAKVDVPTGVGFSVRVGSELEVLASASGRVLLAFQDEDTRRAWIEEASSRRQTEVSKDLGKTLDQIRKRGHESARSQQFRGLHAVSFPVTDFRGHAIAALTVPYVDRIDEPNRKTIAETVELLAAATTRLRERTGGISPVDG